VYFHGSWTYGGKQTKNEMQKASRVFSGCYIQLFFKEIKIHLFFSDELATFYWTNTSEDFLQ
jgi:hypothetical protein